jgi:hypothetical protein
MDDKTIRFSNHIGLDRYNDIVLAYALTNNKLLCPEFLQEFNSILPRDFHYIGKNSLVIRNGILIQGVLTISSIGKNNKSIPDVLCYTHGEIVAQRFCDELSTSIRKFVNENSHNMSIY